MICPNCNHCHSTYPPLNRVHRRTLAFYWVICPRCTFQFGPLTPQGQYPIHEAQTALADLRSRDTPQLKLLKENL